MGFGIVCYEPISKNVINLLSYAISTHNSSNSRIACLYLPDRLFTLHMIYLCITYKTDIVNIPIL